MNQMIVATMRIVGYDWEVNGGNAGECGGKYRLTYTPNARVIVVPLPTFLSIA